MKKLLGAWKMEEARNCHAPVQKIMSCNRSLDFAFKKYVIFKTRMHSTSTTKKSKNSHLFITIYAIEGRCVAGCAERISW
jgi:hypothetical protein